MLIFPLLFGVVAGLVGALARERSRSRVIHLEPMDPEAVDLETLDLTTVDHPETVDLRTVDLDTRPTDDAERG